MDNIVLSLLVDNTSGVLSRVSGLFSRRGYNIDSVTVGVTENPAYSRMTDQPCSSAGQNPTMGRTDSELSESSQRDGC